MKIEKRYVVGFIFLIPMLPIVLAGYLAFWLYMYAVAGYDLGQVVYDWIDEKVNK